VTVSFQRSVRPVLVGLAALVFGGGPRVATAESLRHREFAYVVSKGDTAIDAYAIDGATGALTRLPSTATAQDPAPIAIDPFNRFLYVGCVTDTGGRISGFRVSPQTGALLPIAGSPFPAHGDPEGLVIDPSGRFLYMADQLLDVVVGYRINPLTGALTPLPGSPYAGRDNLFTLAVDPRGRFLFVSSIGTDGATLLVYAIDPRTGVPTLVDSIDVGPSVYGLAADATGQFVYAASATAKTLSAFHVGSDGHLTALPWSPVTLDAEPGWLSLAPLGIHLYIGMFDGTVEPFRVDLATGGLTPIIGPEINGLFTAFEGTGRFAYSSYGPAAGLAGYRAGSNGALTSLAGSPFPSGAHEYQIVATRFNLPAVGLRAELQTPRPGTTLDADTVTFGWTAAADPDEYRISIGSAPGASDIADESAGLDLTHSLKLPTDGRKLYVRLWTRTAGLSLFNDYVFRAVRFPLVSIQDTSVLEGQTGTRLARFVVRLSAPSRKPVTVSYQTSDGTAVAPADYLAASGTLSFPPGVVAAMLNVPVVGDTLDEGNETFSVTLSAPVNADLGRSQASATIVDDDHGGVLDVSPVAVVVKESAGVARLTIRRGGGLASGVTVAYATADGTAVAGSDYTATSGIVSFGAGEFSKEISIPILDDGAVEPDETFSLSLSAPTGGAHLGTHATAVITIHDDDAPTH
jgi:6-phosphogluconolactonase (cycloisomerase 2 family)